MKFENLFNNFDFLPFPIILIDSNFKVLDWNEHASSVFMYSKNEAIGSVVIELIVSELEDFKASISKAGSDAYSEFINENMRKDGERIVCKWQCKAIYGASSEKYIMLIAKDITNEKKHCQEKAIYEALVSQTPSLISTYKDMKPLYMNDAFKHFSDGLLLNNNVDLSELLSTMESLDYIDNINELKNNESYGFDVQIKHQLKKHNLHVTCFNITLEGTVHHAMIMDDYSDVHEMNENIDHTKNLLKELDVLASLGTMTAGLMHEINNPLSYLASNVEFIKSIFPKLKIETSQDIKDEIVETFADIQVAISQILEIIKSIKGFVSLDDEETFVVSDEIMSVLKLAKNDYKYDCEIVLDLDQSLTLKGSSVKFRQIVFNLLSNAIYAIVEKKSSTKLRIEITSKFTNDNTEIIFRDYGIGIEATRVDDIFKVFSTDKPKGVGTGLGLSLIKEFIEEDFGGRISVASEVGKFAEFRILFPLHVDSSDMDSLDNKVNCWEYMECGREVGGINSSDFGVCSVLLNTALDGVHGGKQAGRSCWIVAGTLCNGQIQGSYASKLDSCRNCNFYKLVKEQEKNKIKSQSELLRLIRDDYFKN